MPLGDRLAEIHPPPSKLEGGVLFQKTDRRQTAFKVKPNFISHSQSTDYLLFCEFTIT